METELSEENPKQNQPKRRIKSFRQFIEGNGGISVSKKHFRVGNSDSRVPVPRDYEQVQ